MIKKLSLIALTAIFMQNSFALTIHNGHLISEQEWSKGNDLLRVKKAPEILQRNTKKLFTKSEDQENLIAAIIKIDHLPSIAAPDDLIVGLVEHAYKIVNNSDIPKTYEIITEHCLFVHDKSFCTEKKSLIQVNQGGSMDADESDELSFQVLNKYPHYLVSKFTVHAMEDHTNFVTADSAMIEVNAE